MAKPYGKILFYINRMHVSNLYPIIRRSSEKICRLKGEFLAKTENSCLSFNSSIKVCLKKNKYKKLLTKHNFCHAFLLIVTGNIH